jgi:tetratricopeptide (TPR) repeat protein
VDEEAMDRDSMKPSLGHQVVPLLLAFALSGGALFAMVTSPSEAELAFNRGVNAYRARAYADAVSFFEESARQAPRAPDAWANYGTAAWSAGKTSEATIGWQRALRMEPLAADVRERLGEMRGWSLETTLLRAAEFAARVCTLHGAFDPDSGIYAEARERWTD